MPKKKKENKIKKEERKIEVFTMADHLNEAQDQNQGFLGEEKIIIPPTLNDNPKEISAENQLTIPSSENLNKKKDDKLEERENNIPPEEKIEEIFQAAEAPQDILGPQIDFKEEKEKESQFVEEIPGRENNFPNLHQLTNQENILSEKDKEKENIVFPKEVGAVSEISVPFPLPSGEGKLASSQNDMIYLPQNNFKVNEGISDIPATGSNKAPVALEDNSTVAKGSLWKKILIGVGIFLGVLGLGVGLYFALNIFVFKIKNPLAILPEDKTLGFLYINQKNQEFNKLNDFVKQKTGKDFLDFSFTEAQKVLFGEEILSWYGDLRDWIGENIAIGYSYIKENNGNGVAVVLEIKDNKKAQESIKKISDKMVSKNFVSSEENFEGYPIQKITLLKNKNKEENFDEFKINIDNLYITEIKNYAVFSNNFDIVTKIILTAKNPKENKSIFQNSEMKNSFDDFSSHYPLFIYSKIDGSFNTLFQYKDILVGVKADDKDLILETNLTSEKELKNLVEFEPNLISLLPKSTFYFSEIYNLKNQIDENYLNYFKNLVGEKSQQDIEIFKQFISLFDKNTIVFSVIDSELNPEISPEEFYNKNYFGFIADVSGIERGEVVSKLISIENLLKNYINKKREEYLKKEGQILFFNKEFLEKIHTPAEIKRVDFGEGVFYSVGPNSIFERDGTFGIMNEMVESYNFAYFDNKVFFATSQAGIKELILIAKGKSESLTQKYPEAVSFDDLRYPASSYFLFNLASFSDGTDTIFDYFLEKEESDLINNLIKFKDIKFIKAAFWRPEKNKDSFQIKIIFK